MKKFTVLLLLPDDFAENYGQDTYAAWVVAEKIEQALPLARLDAAQAAEYDGDPDDYFVLFACEGHMVDLAAGVES